MNESIEQAMRSARGSLQAEGLVITDKHTDLVRQVLTGKITEEEFLQRALDNVKQENK